MITEQWKRVMLHNQTHKIVHSSDMYCQNLIIIHECSKKLLKMKNSKSFFFTPSTLNEQSSTLPVQWVKRARGENVRGNNVRGENVSSKNVRGNNVRGKNCRDNDVKGFRNRMQLIMQEVKCQVEMSTVKLWKLEISKENNFINGCVKKSEYYVDWRTLSRLDG